MAKAQRAVYYLRRMSTFFEAEVRHALSRLVQSVIVLAGASRNEPPSANNEGSTGTHGASAPPTHAIAQSSERPPERPPERPE
jgi:hypothetical protein